ncbi:hypothetical protein Tco_0142680, partial [Tanacetum coccineum]
SGCSGSMTGDKDKLLDFKDYKGGYVAFGNDPKGRRITGKGTIKTSCIDFENVSYVKELNMDFERRFDAILKGRVGFVENDLNVIRFVMKQKEDLEREEE